ncbi:MAG: RNA polymerase sigma factor [Bacillota bacterium]
MESSDEKLIELCKNGKREGYELLFKKYEKYIYKLCWHYTNSKEDSLDLVQEIYIKVFNGIRDFDQKRPILPWLKKITINTCLNHIRDRKENAVSLETSIDDENHRLEHIVSSSISVEEEFSFLDTKRLLEKAIKELPEDMKTAVILRHVSGLSYNQIGEIMELPIGTVKTYLFRGRRMLKDKLKHEGVWEVS